MSSEDHKKMIKYLHCQSTDFILKGDPLYKIHFYMFFEHKCVLSVFQDEINVRIYLSICCWDLHFAVGLKVGEGGVRLL